MWSNRVVWKLVAAEITSRIFTAMKWALIYCLQSNWPSVHWVSAYLHVVQLYSTWLQASMSTFRDDSIKFTKFGSLKFLFQTLCNENNIKLSSQFWSSSYILAPRSYFKKQQKVGDLEENSSASKEKEKVKENERIKDVGWIDRWTDDNMIN